MKKSSHVGYHSRPAHVGYHSRPSHVGNLILNAYFQNVQFPNNIDVGWNSNSILCMPSVVPHIGRIFTKDSENERIRTEQKIPANEHIHLKIKKVRAKTNQLLNAYLKKEK